MHLSTRCRWMTGAAEDRGILQVTPVGWDAAGKEWDVPRWVRTSGVWEAMHRLVHVPVVGQLAGRAVLARRLRQAKGNIWLALRAYNCGGKGLYARCGGKYILRIKTERKRQATNTAADHRHHAKPAAS